VKAAPGRAVQPVADCAACSHDLDRPGSRSAGGIAVLVRRRKHVKVNDDGLRKKLLAMLRKQKEPRKRTGGGAIVGTEPFAVRRVHDTSAPAA